MFFKIKFVVYPLVLNVLFLFSGVAFAAQATADTPKPAERCLKGGKELPTAKTRGNCTKDGGTWVKMAAPKMPIDPLEKGKAIPPDPFDKSMAIPPDPYGKGKAMPSGGN